MWAFLIVGGFATFVAYTVWLPGTRFTDADEVLFRAARHGDVAGIDAALNAGAGINDQSPVDGKTALFRAAILGHADAVRALLNKDADANLRGYDGKTPIEVVNDALGEEKNPAAVTALRDVAAVLNQR